eukprot:6171988-Pleurochrysis_carterae.AAC.2
MHTHNLTVALGRFLQSQYMAKLAEESERFEEMLEFMRAVATSKVRHFIAPSLRFRQIPNKITARKHGVRCL